MSSLAERLSAERHRRFVGRNSELKLFQSSVAAAELPFHLLHIFGPGGVGKTTLLLELTRICKQMGIPAISIDGRNLEPAPESFLSGLRFLMGLNPDSSPLQVLAQSNQRHVLIIDTYETLAPLNDWLREEFLPQLPENTLIVLAGRNPPQSAWRTDSGWQALLHIISLRNLSLEESSTYLSRRQIPSDRWASVFDFTHGHPLALSLVADVFAQAQVVGSPGEATPDVVKTLLERFVQEVPTPIHRMALEACAMVRLTTETLLTQMLDIADSHELFEWLRSLSFMEAGRFGLFPHDLAREVLAADLRWRNPELYAELHRRARIYYSNRLGKTQAQEQHAVLFDYIYLHRDNPAVRPRFTWQENSSLLTDTLRESDKPILLLMVAQHEGEASAKIAEYWMAQQPQGVLVFRDTQQQPVGFVLMVALHQATEQLQADPGAQATMRYLQQYAPLRLNEGATLFRFWMAQDTYQSVSPTQSLIFINFVQHHRNTPGLAYTFFVCASPEYWAVMFAYADLARVSEADFEVGGRRYSVYGHDWRLVSPVAWQELLAQREIAASTQIETPPVLKTNEPLLVLSQSEFVQSVQDALRNFSRPHGLQNNPLLRSRLILERVSSGHPPSQVPCGERITILQTLIEQAAQSLQSSPRQAKYYQALYRTYLHPAPTQEQAAFILNLPFSTFRRHLKAGITQVCDILWQWEIGI